MAFSARSSATATAVEVGRVDGLALFVAGGLDGGGGSRGGSRRPARPRALEPFTTPAFFGTPSTRC